jgi:undecaprenyl diphosphate synthase
MAAGGGAGWPAGSSAGQTLPSLPLGSLPRHVAVIADGNRRWAISRGLTPLEGQWAGLKAFINIVHGVVELGLPCLSVYGFSTENWGRAPRDVAGMLEYFPQAAREIGEIFHGLGVRFRWSGRQDRVGSAVAEELGRLEGLTCDNRSATVVMCVDYGGRAEIAAAANTIARDAAAGRLAGDEVDEAVFAGYLSHPDLPDVDLLIRTGGQRRTSNFLLWQAAYAELYFTDMMWPDFDRRAFWHALTTYTDRTRTFGADSADQPPSRLVNDGEFGAGQGAGS